MDRCEGTMSWGTYFGKPLSPNPKLGGHRFHSNEEVEMAIHELSQRRDHNSATMEFLNSCQNGTNASVCWRIVFKNDASLV